VQERLDPLRASWILLTTSLPASECNELRAESKAQQHLSDWDGVQRGLPSGCCTSDKGQLLS
jgi:hypothetical protein